MAEWISFLHAPRERFAETASEDERRTRNPAVASGLMRGELRPFRVSLLRGRDQG